MRRSKSLSEFVPEIERFLHKRKRVARNNTVMAERVGTKGVSQVTY